MFSRFAFNSIVLLVFSFLIFTHELLAQVFINEVMSSNDRTISDEDGEFKDWIELYNSSDSEVYLKGMYLSDDIKKLNKWQFSQGKIPAKGFILIWASSKNKVGADGQIHTNFSISADGEELILSNSNGQIVDSISVPPLDKDLSYARIPDGSDNWEITGNTTPRNNNVYIETLTPPIFSKEGGIYTDPFKLNLSHTSSDVTLIYTLDGSDPSINNLDSQKYFYKNSYKEFVYNTKGPLIESSYQSLLYNDEIDIENINLKPNRLANISTTFNFEPNYFPKNLVDKCIVVKALAYKNGESSKIVTNSYFIKDTSEFNSPISIISLTSNDTSFFDFNKGLYVAGVDFEDWRKLYPLFVANYTSPANYNRRGDENEFPLTFEMFDSELKTKVFNQNLGFRIHGSSTRVNPQKSLRLYARNEYGKSSINYNLFSEKGQSYKRLILRSYDRFRLGDTFAQAMVRHLKLDSQIERTCLVYLNGEFFGIFELKERLDKFYLKRKYDLDSENLDMLFNNLEVDEGDNKNYKELIKFIKNNSLSSNENFEELKKKIDTDNYTDYQIAEIFLGNTDWPYNNVNYWRYKTEFNPNAPYGQDGRWRWMLYDLDYAFGLIDKNDCTYNTLNLAIKDGDEWSTLLFYNLLKNEKFKINFINRFADLLNTTFLPERLESIINEKVKVVQPYANQHDERWSIGGGKFDQRILAVQQYVECRRGEVFKHLAKQFSLMNTYQVNIDVDEKSHPNFVKINTIDIHENTVGVSANPYPWKGEYFNGVPIEISAIAAPGFEFDYWEGMPDETPASFIQNFEKDIELVAHFKVRDSTQYNLIYTSSFGGYLVGDSVQIVIKKDNGTAVKAIPNSGYQFQSWSDKRVDNPRIDSNIMSDINVKALFEKATLILTESNLYLKIYPNPVANRLIIETNKKEDISYQIINLNGQVLKGIIAAGNSIIDVSTLPSSIYLLLVTDQKGNNSSQKFIKN